MNRSGSRIRDALAIIVAGAGLATVALAGEPWPQFRGPQARGVSDAVRIPDRWSATDNVAWKTDLPSRGWSSPIVWGNRVFVATAIFANEDAEPKKGLYFGGNRSAPPDAVCRWNVVCFDLGTGAVIWNRTVHEGQPQWALHIKNS